MNCRRVEASSFLAGRSAASSRVRNQLKPNSSVILLRHQHGRAQYRQHVAGLTSSWRSFVGLKRSCTNPKPKRYRDQLWFAPNDIWGCMPSRVWFHPSQPETTQQSQHRASLVPTHRNGGHAFRVANPYVHDKKEHRLSLFVVRVCFWPFNRPHYSTTRPDGVQQCCVSATRKRAGAVKSLSCTLPTQDARLKALLATRMSSRCSRRTLCKSVRTLLGDHRLWIHR